MNRGDLYLVGRRVFAVVSRQVLIDSCYSTVICAPVYSARSGLSTQVPLGTETGLKREGAIHCDELISIPKSRLTDLVGALSHARLRELDRALTIALGVA